MTTHSLPFIPTLSAGRRCHPVVWYACAIHLHPFKLRPFCSSDDAYPSSTNQTRLAHQKIHRLTFRQANNLFAGNLTPTPGLWVHSRMKSMFTNTSPIHNSFAMSPNPHRSHCSQWRHERLGVRSQTLLFLLGNSTRYFPPPTHGGQT